MLRAGADKVAINTAAIRNKTLISAAARMFGSSTILVSIEVIKQSNGAYLAFTDNGREHTGIELTDWLRQVEDLGAGEVLLTSIDREGTGHGFDVELMKLATSLLSIPVIAHGGGSSSEHIQEVVKEARVDAVALASMLHYPALAEVSPIAADEEGNTAFLQSGRTFSRFGSLQLHDLKRELHGFGLRIRMPADARCRHN